MSTDTQFWSFIDVAKRRRRYGWSTSVEDAAQRIQRETRFTLEDRANLSSIAQSLESIANREQEAVVLARLETASQWVDRAWWLWVEGVAFVLREERKAIVRRLYFHLRDHRNEWIESAVRSLEYGHTEVQWRDAMHCFAFHPRVKGASKFAKWWRSVRRDVERAFSDRSDFVRREITQ